MRFCLSSPPLRISLPLILFFVTVEFFFPTLCPAHCSVPTIRANGEFFKSDFVFTGTVLSIRKTPDTDREFGGWFYRLSVQEIFRGPVREELTVYTEDTDIRFPLEKDRQYLLFAYQKHGRVEIDSCGNSALVRDARDSLRRLKKLRDGKQPTEIEGWVVAETGGIDVSSVVVTVRSRSRAYTAITNKEGWFHFRVPRGKYWVDFTSKEYYLNGGDEFWYDPDHFYVHPGECASLQFVSVRHLTP